MELLCLWPPGFCGVPSLHVRSPVSGPVCVLPQSTIVTLLSLLWLGLLLVFLRFHCLRLTLWASACVGPHGCPTFSRIGADPSTWVPLLWPGCRGTFHPVPSPLSSFGMWSPFGVISVFCHYWSPTKVSIGGVFLLGGSLPFRSGVVVSVRPLSVCHGSLWLVTALFPSLSLSLPVPIFSWLLLLLRQVPYFPYGCAHTCSWAWGFLCFLPALRPPSGSWYTGSCGFSSPLGFPTFAMGSPLRGRRLFVLDWNEGLVSPFGSGTLVSSWLDLPPLSAGICAPCPSGCVARWSSLCP